MVNPDVDIYNKTLDHRKILRKAQNTTIWKSKEC